MGWVLLGFYVTAVIVGAVMGHLRAGNATYGALWPFVLGPLGLVLSYFLLKSQPPREDQAVRSSFS